VDEDGPLLVVLLDQVTRNVYRGTPQAYSGDEVALSLTLSLAVSSIESLPFHFQATVCVVCRCHAEDAHIQGILRACLDKIENQRCAGSQHACSLAALREMQKEHEERIVLFGRLPREEQHRVRSCFRRKTRVITGYSDGTSPLADDNFYW